MADLDPDDAASRGALYPIESDHHAVASIPRGWVRQVQRIAWIVLVAALAVAVVVWLIRVQASLARLEKGLAAGAASLGEADPDVKKLEARFAKVLGASVETKLRRLERRVERGTLSGEDLDLLESAAGELKLLRAQPPAVLHADAGAEHPRYRTVGTPAGSPADGVTLEQISDLQSFIRVLVVCFAIFALALMGLWYRTARQVRIVAANPPRQLPAMHSRAEKQRGA